MRFSALGDVAIVMPLMYALCKANPDTDFVFVTKKPYVRLAVNPPANLKLVGADTRGRHKGVGGLSRLAADLQSPVKPAVVIDLHDVLRTRVVRTLMRLRGARVTVFSKERAGKRALVSRGAANAPEVTSTVSRYADAFLRSGLVAAETLEPLTVRWPIPNCTFSLSRKDGEYWVGVAPFAAHASKIYPTDLMLKALKAAAQQHNIRFFLFGGGPIETPLLQRMASQLPDSVCVASSGLGMADELSLMSRLDVMVSMDSGNMHMASIVGTSTVSIWGGTHPAAGFQPVTVAPGQEHIMLQDTELECRPCSVFGQRPCRYGQRPPCMEKVLPEEHVAAAIIELAGKERGKRFDNQP